MTALKLQLSYELVNLDNDPKNSYKWKYKEETKSQLEGGAEMGNGLVPHLHVVLKHWK